MSYAFDSVGRRSRMIDPDNGRFTYGYDDVGRTTKVINPQNKRTTLGYDEAGRQTLQIHGNVSRTTQLYDAASRLTGQIQADGIGVSRRTTNSYDATGKRTFMNESSGVRTSWIYDASGQLQREQRNGTGSFDVTHLYDPAGNRTLMIDSGTRTTATYDAANELLVEKTGAARTTYQYDANGNTTRKDTGAALTIYDWDVRNRMTSAKPVGTPVTCTYSGDNKRVKKEVGATTKQFLYDYENLLRETDGSGNLDREYTSTTEQYGDLLNAYDGSSTSYYEFDPQYSTEALLDDSGSVTDRYKYRAYGLSTHPTGSSTQPHTFVGRQGYYNDPQIDLYYVRRRYYDPVTARWRSEDNDGYGASGPNLYSYGNNDPVNATDPSGQAPCPRAGEIEQWIRNAKRIVAEHRKKDPANQAARERDFDRMLRVIEKWQQAGCEGRCVIETKKNVDLSFDIGDKKKPNSCVKYLHEVKAEEVLDAIVAPPPLPDFPVIAQNPPVLPPAPFGPEFRCVEENRPSKPCPGAGEGPSPRIMRPEPTEVEMKPGSLFPRKGWLPLPRCLVELADIISFLAYLANDIVPLKDILDILSEFGLTAEQIKCIREAIEKKGAEAKDAFFGGIEDAVKEFFNNTANLRDGIIYWLLGNDPTAYASNLSWIVGWGLESDK